LAGDVLPIFDEPLERPARHLRVVGRQPQASLAGVAVGRYGAGWSYNGSILEAPAMGVNLSVKDVPDELAEALRARARANHRSLQGELMAIIEAHVGTRPFRAQRLLQDVRALRLSTGRDAARTIRADRDER
jgi:antitoxin FitA